LRKLTLFAIGTLAALAVVGAAIANGGFGGTRSAKAVTGTFSATTVTKNDTRSCTASDGKAISITNAAYTGTSTGDPDLTGATTVQLRAIVNTTDNVGAVSGTIKIDTAADKNTTTQFNAVYDHGNIAGLAAGRASTDGVGLLANLSAGFTPTGGLTNGKFGGTSGGSAAEFGPGKCAPTQPERSVAAGTVTAVSSSSITVAGLTCAVPTSLAAQVATIHVNDQAAIRCDVENGTPTLVSVKSGSSQDVHTEAAKLQKAIEELVRHGHGRR